MRKEVLIAAAIVALTVAAWAQEKDYQPTCKGCPGTFIGKAELDAYLKRGIASRITDQQVRSIDIGKSNLGLGMVFRERRSASDSVAEHDLVSEVYHIIEGHATLKLGPDLVGASRRPASSKTVRVQNGPGNGADEIRDGVAYDLSPGDVVVIPAGTGHQFTKIADPISYLMFRIDPEKIVPLKTEADSRADLSTDGTETPEAARQEGEKNRHLEKEYAPSCRLCPGYYVPRSEIDAYVTRAIANQLTDQGIRTVDIGKTNVNVGVVHRSKLVTPEANVAEHDLVSEAYHVIDGSATLKLGPELVGKVRRAPTQTTVRLLNGPGNGAAEIRNGITRDIKAGDVVVIPAGTGHQFTKIEDHITYLIVRVDPDKVLPLKTAADSQADLKTDGRTTAGGGAGAVSSQQQKK